MKILKVTSTDLDELQKIGRQTFTETFSSENSQEDMAEYLENGFSYEKLITELKNKNSEFYFAEFDNEIIGYLKINLGQAQTELKDPNALEIERIYVLKAFQGKNVGQLLYIMALKH